MEGVWDAGDGFEEVWGGGGVCYVGFDEGGGSRAVRWGKGRGTRTREWGLTLEEMNLSRGVEK